MPERWAREDRFAGNHPEMGRRLAPHVLAHNAYVFGFEDGATATAYAVEMTDPRCAYYSHRSRYREGLRAGEVARQEAFARALDIKEEVCGG